MKHLKTFEGFGGGIFNHGFKKRTEKLKKRTFTEVTYPETPFKRNLTKEESMFLYRNFKYHSWSNIDKLGRIILGGGESAAGIFYITEEDLLEYMDDEDLSTLPKKQNSW